MYLLEPRISILLKINFASETVPLELDNRCGSICSVERLTIDISVGTKEFTLKEIQGKLADPVWLTR